MSERETTLKDLLSNPLQTQYEEVLGRLAIRFSLLHAILEHFAWKTWGLHQQFARILTKDLPFSGLIEMLLDGIKELELDDEEHDRAAIIDALKKAKKLAQHRNDLLHALWVFPKGNPVLCIRRRQKDPDPNAPTVEEIDKLCAATTQIALALNDLINPLRTVIALAQKKKYGRPRRA